MIFLTYWFWGFAAIVLPLYWLVASPRVRLPLLVLTCAVFHTHFAGPAGVLPILGLGVLTYVIGLTRSREPLRARDRRVRGRPRLLQVRPLPLRRDRRGPQPSPG